MYECMYVSIFIYLSIYLSIYVCIYVSMYLCIYVCMYVCIYLSIYVSMYLCIYVSMYLCIYVSMYLCIYIYSCYVYKSLPYSCLGWLMLPIYNQRSMNFPKKKTWLFCSLNSPGSLLGSVSQRKEDAESWPMCGSPQGNAWDGTHRQKSR